MEMLSRTAGCGYTGPGFMSTAKSLPIATTFFDTSNGYSYKV